MVLIHQRAPPAKGDHPQNWRATDPSTSGHQPHNWSSRRFFFKPRVRRSRSRGQTDKSHYGQSDISSTSCPSTCWRLWYRRCYHSTVSICLLSAVRCPLVSYFSSLRLGGVFSRFVLLVVRVPARKVEEEQRPCGGGVSGPLGARSLCCSWCSQS